ncbi:MAG: putative 5xTM rane YitT family, partial [Evtepia sp.]|nr:putative 5xTM rane YitT family [Evtepia sp.]
MKKWMSYLRSYAVITLASVIYALAFNIFYAPNDIAFGGVTGISQMI